MAGLVAVDLLTLPMADAPIGLVARCCPVDEAYGRSCVKLDERTGQLAVCPLWYGTVIKSGPLPWEVRGLQSLRKWMGTARGMQWRGYHTRCLAAAQSTVEAGARL